MWRDTRFLFRWHNLHILNVAEGEDYSLIYIHSCEGQPAPFRKFSNAMQDWVSIKVTLRKLHCCKHSAAGEGFRVLHQRDAGCFSWSLSPEDLSPWYLCVVSCLWSPQAESIYRDTQDEALPTESISLDFKGHFILKQQDMEGKHVNLIEAQVWGGTRLCVEGQISEGFLWN